jgi:hypothetical protein
MNHDQFENVLILKFENEVDRRLSGLSGYVMIDLKMVGAENYKKKVKSCLEE